MVRESGRKREVEMRGGKRERKKNLYAPGNRHTHNDYIDYIVYIIILFLYILYNII